MGKNKGDELRKKKRGGRTDGKRSIGRRKTKTKLFLSSHMDKYKVKKEKKKENCCCCYQHCMMSLQLPPPCCCHCLSSSPSHIADDACCHCLSTLLPLLLVANAVTANVRYRYHHCQCCHRCCRICLLTLLLIPNIPNVVAMIDAN